MSARAVDTGWGPAALALLFALACASAAPLADGPLRLSELTGQGDARRQASLHAVLEGLDADLRASAPRALGLYERAIQIDPTNPFAYLALSRHHVGRGDPLRALEYLDQAEMLLDAQQDRSPRVDAHLAGLRGAALRARGREREAAPLLARARALAPVVWSDGNLGAGELR